MARARPRRVAVTIGGRFGRALLGYHCHPLRVVVAGDAVSRRLHSSGTRDRRESSVLALQADVYVKNGARPADFDEMGSPPTLHRNIKPGVGIEAVE